MVAAIADAVIGPMPGILASRRLMAFVLCSRTITASTASIRFSRACSSAIRPRNASRANAGTTASSASCSRLIRSTTRCRPAGAMMPNS